MVAKVIDYSGSAQTFSDMDISPSDETGLDSIMYVEGRGLPWWQTIGSKDAGKFGVRVLKDLVTADEALVAAGLDWNVKQVALGYKFGSKHHNAERYLANVRDDSGDLLGVVSPSYRVIQNKEAFAFADALVDSGDAKFETAGALFGGRTVVLSMELDSVKGIRVAGEKEEGEVHTYLVLRNTHDGSGNLMAMVTPVRWVCKNTLNLGLKHHRAAFKIRHVGSMAGKIEAARNALGITFEYVAEFQQMAERLAMKQVVDDQVAEIMKRVFSSELSEDRVFENSQAGKALDLYYASDTLEGIRGTGWGVLNAVAEYADHKATFRGRGASSAEDIRAGSILWGHAQDQKEKALSLLLKI